MRLIVIPLLVGCLTLVVVSSPRRIDAQEILNRQEPSPVSPSLDELPTPQASDPWTATDDVADPSDSLEFAPLTEEGPVAGVSAFVGYDAWRGTSDGGWENNGIHTGVNFGTRLGRLSDWTGIGMQLGGSVGAFNWSGTDYRISHRDEAQPQGFLTCGFFRRAQFESNWNAALVQDWMFNSNYGVFAQNPTLGQWRGQIGYLVSPANEFGVWGTWRAHSDTRHVRYFGPVTWRPINQLNPYWHHKWGAFGADTWLWVGVPERERLSGNGSLGDYVVGASAVCPLNNQVSLYSLVTYLHPSASAGPAAAREDAWNFTIGLSFYPGRNARSRTIAGQTWMPLMPVANNGYFLVDASQNY